MWMIMIFVSAMRDFNTVLFAFAFGLFVSFIVLYFYGYNGAFEALWSFCLGITITIGILFGILVKEFDYQYSGFKFIWLRQTDFYILLLSGFFFYASMWADKIIYWFDSDFGKQTIKGFYFFPQYDFAMFVAYLTMIPAVAYFSVFVETVFYDEQKKYLSAIENKKDIWHIKASAQALFECFLKSILNVFTFQFLIALTFILILIPIFDFYKIAPESIPLLRIALLCALLQLVLQVIIIFIYYFDFQKEALIITLFSFISNLILTLYLKDFGFAMVGYSYFASLLLSIILALSISYYKLSRINFYTFMNNEVI
jgi:uncharacterized membrane protein